MAEMEAVEKENVVISAGECSVTILPHLGGKIASILIGDRELLQSPLAPYAARTRSMSFDAGDASGWDECLPSVAACTVKTEAGKATIPDHGDLWRVEWKGRDQGIGNREQGTGTARGSGDCSCFDCAPAEGYYLQRGQSASSTTDTSPFRQNSALRPA
jgi:hypothetical protein